MKMVHEGRRKPRTTETGRKDTMHTRRLRLKEFVD